jgi:four helix bundle protein
MTANSPLQDNIIVEKTFQFAVAILKFSQSLQEQRHFVLSNQLLKSGTSIGANTREAQNAESRADFIHKFKIAAKEADETEYWLLLCNEVSDKITVQILLADLKIIQKIITKIIATTKTQLAIKLISKSTN